MTAEDGAAALLAPAGDGRVAVWRTDGRGPSASVSEWARLKGATVTTSYDLAKDSLPILGWTLWHPGFDRAAGTLTICGADLTRADHPPDRRGASPPRRRLLAKGSDTCGTVGA
jgi:hypothetical protein